MFKFLFKCCCCWGKLGSATTTSRELVCCHSKFQPVLKKKVQRCFRIHELVVNQLFPSAGLWTLVLSSADVERCDGWFGYSQQTANSPPEGISCATHWFSHHRRRLALVQICRSRAVMFRRHSGGVGERRRESEKLTNISKSAAESILVVMWHPPPPVNACWCVCVDTCTRRARFPDRSWILSPNPPRLPTQLKESLTLPSCFPSGRNAQWCAGARWLTINVTMLIGLPPPPSLPWGNSVGLLPPVALVTWLQKTLTWSVIVRLNTP